MGSLSETCLSNLANISALLGTTADLLGRGIEDFDSWPILTPLPLQLRGLGTNLAAFFEQLEGNEYGKGGRFHVEKARVADYLVEMFSCLSGEDNSEDQFSVLGMLEH